MIHEPRIIRLEEVADVVSERFKGRELITCYVGSNAATPTAALEALTKGIESGSPKLPFMRMVHLLLQGEVPYVKKGLQDRVMAYSIFSAESLRKAANEGRAYYLPCTLANLDSLIGKGRPYQPDLVIMKVSRLEHTGELSLGLTVEGLPAAIENAELVIAELDNSMPFTSGQSVLDSRSIHCLVVDDAVKPVYDFPAPDFDDLPPRERRIGELITEHFITDGVTLQVGIGKITDAVVSMIRDGNYNDLGVHTELYSDGLMHLQKMGIVTNRRKQLDFGYSTTSLVMGSKELYDFVHMRAGVHMRPCEYTNSSETIRKNAPFISINTAIGVDLFGNVWADFIDARRYYSGVGGQPDFVRALDDPVYGTPIIAVKSVTQRGDSKIARVHPPGVSLTASAYDGVVIVTEYGIADLRGLTAGAKALAIASIAHPSYRDGLLRYVCDDPLFTKPRDFSLGKTPDGVTFYKGSTKLAGET
jgi:4-hydroxybutyrate CoA-transferase